MDSNASDIRESIPANVRVGSNLPVKCRNEVGQDGAEPIAAVGGEVFQKIGGLARRVLRGGRHDGYSPYNYPPSENGLTAALAHIGIKVRSRYERDDDSEEDQKAISFHARVGAEYDPWRQARKSSEL